MTKKQFHNLLKMAPAFQSAEAFSVSLIPDGCTEYIMYAIWKLSKDFTFPAIIKLYNGSTAAFSAEYDIPIRTVEDWKAGVRNPPEYVLEFLAADVLANRIPMSSHKKTYYLPTTDWDTFFGVEHPVCIDEAERNRLSAEWGLDAENDFREATKDDIAEYGVYDS